MHDSWHSCQTKNFENVTSVAGRGRKSERASEVFLRKREGERRAGCLAEGEREVIAAARDRH